MPRIITTSKPLDPCHLTEISGFGDCLETQSIDALGKITKSLADGSGRVLKSIDAEGNASTAQYDANGNVTQSRDPNGVGYDAVYDALNRMTSQTDTWGDETSSAYDLAGNVISQTDAKDKTTTIAFDAANRRISSTDRISGDTDYVYDLAGNLTSITDAESQVTAYAYNNLGQKYAETYPDHTGGSSGSSTYGIVEFAFDPAGRLQLKTDQNGDTSSLDIGHWTRGFGPEFEASWHRSVNYCLFSRNALASGSLKTAS